ncbi:MAG TPA: hypothetical protein VLK27_10975 [Chthoniobacterales bacterium]|nr:hypothetical protein [Chthoniobacterales bacterium]
MNITFSFNKTLIAILLATSTARISVLAGNLPDMRPALVGNGKDSLINMFNPQNVLKRGETHGALYFGCIVAPNGVVEHGNIWGNTDATKALRDELRIKLSHCRFVPAVYNHRDVYCWFQGTLAFSTIDGKPHVRIFANQQLADLQKESDFITPQMISVPGHIYDFTKVKDPFGGWATDDKPVVADMSLSVDASGKVKDIHLEKVTPPDQQKYAATAVEILKQRTWLPAYRNGRPVDSTTQFRYYFIPTYYSLQ